MSSTAPRDPRDTTATAAWPPGADVVTFRLLPAYIARGDTLTVTIDAEHRLRRLIRRLNAGRP